MSIASGHSLLDTPVTYPDDGTPPYIYSTFSHLATRSVVAAIDNLTGQAQTLTLGATENIVLESSKDVHVVLKNDGVFELYNHIADGSHVKFVSLYHSSQNNNVVLSTGTNALMIDSPVVHMNDLQVNGYFNIEGGIIGNSLNVVKYDSTSDSFCKGYGFRINTRDELELVKYAVYDTDGSHSSVIKKVAIFGTGNLFTPLDASASNNDLLPFNAVGGTNLSNLLGSVTTPCGVPSESQWIYNSTANTLIVSPSNVYVGINKAVPEANLHVDGTAIISTITCIDCTIYSDMRLKENVTFIDELSIGQCLEKINTIRLARYNYKENPKSRLGFIAQQVENITSDVVSQTKYGDILDCRTIDMNILLAYTIGAIQKLSSLITNA